MTRREKTMAGAVLGAVLVLGGASLINARVVRPLADKRVEVKRLRERNDELLSRLAAEPRSIVAWQKHTARTLHASASEAQRLFRGDLESLLGANGFTQVRLTPLQPSTERRGFRTGFTEVAFVVSAQARLEQVSALLRGLYERPYFVRVDRVTLTPTTSAVAARPGQRNGGGEEPVLSFSMTVATLVLPEVDSATHTPLTQDVLADPRRLAQMDPGLLREDPSVYDEIHATNLFKLYVPPPPVVAKPVDRPPAETPRPATPAPPPPDPWADAAHLTLRATTSLDGVPVAYIEDGRRTTQPPTEHRLNDSLLPATLVVIHPAGIVVRERYGAEHGPRFTDYWIPLGARLSDRQVFAGEVVLNYPDVARDLQRAFPQ